MTDAEREGFEPSIPLDAVYRISRASERGARQGTEGHFVFARSSECALRGGAGTHVGSALGLDWGADES